MRLGIFLITSFFFVDAVQSHILNEQTELALREHNYKQAIELKTQCIKQSEENGKSRHLKDLAICYLKDQNHEKAFESFLESLQQASLFREFSGEKPIETDNYKKALALYLDQTSLSTTAIAEKIIAQFLPAIENEQDPLTGYLIALSYANLSNYEEFFCLFYDSYLSYPEHFLAYKTKAILHIKLMERMRYEEQRQLQREKALTNFSEALALEPQDTSLYKMLITFSILDDRDKQIQLCLNKIIEHNIIIPRIEVMFYVREAVNVKEVDLAQCFMEKASIWYPNSRMISAAQSYLNSHK